MAFPKGTHSITAQLPRLSDGGWSEAPSLTQRTPDDSVLLGWLRESLRFTDFSYLLYYRRQDRPHRARAPNLPVENYTQRDLRRAWYQLWQRTHPFVLPPTKNMLEGDVLSIFPQEWVIATAGYSYLLWETQECVVPGPTNTFIRPPTRRLDQWCAEHHPDIWFSAARKLDILLNEGLYYVGLPPIPVYAEVLHHHAPRMADIVSERVTRRFLTTLHSAASVASRAVWSEAHVHASAFKPGALDGTDGTVDEDLLLGVDPPPEALGPRTPQDVAQQVPNRDVADDQLDDLCRSVPGLVEEVAVAAPPPPAPTSIPPPPKRAAPPRIRAPLPDQQELSQAKAEESIERQADTIANAVFKNLPPEATKEEVVAAFDREVFHLAPPSPVRPIQAVRTPEQMLAPGEPSAPPIPTEYFLRGALEAASDRTARELTGAQLSLEVAIKAADIIFGFDTAILRKVIEHPEAFQIPETITLKYLADMAKTSQVISSALDTAVSLSRKVGGEPDQTILHGLLFLAHQMTPQEREHYRLTREMPGRLLTGGGVVSGGDANQGQSAVIDAVFEEAQTGEESIPPAGSQGPGRHDSGATGSILDRFRAGAPR